ncbi:unnamed protein product [Peniophora sp. CBMAI 1063]|nr:unnamed protein product [Peniophora sp. CBMAI 1063]
MEARRSRVERETLILDAKLEILHSQQTKLNALLASVNDDLNELSRQRKFLNDTLIPFYLLPNELICAIFNFVIDSSPPPPLDALVDIVPLRLSQISSRLRGVALSRGNFWRRFVLQASDTEESGPRPITRQFLSRLGHAQRVDAFYYNNAAAKLDTQSSRLLLLIRLPPISSLTIDAQSSAMLDLASHLSMGLIAGLKTLTSLTLHMRRASLPELASIDRRLGYHRTRASPSIPQDLLLHLTHLELKDVPLSVIPATPLPRLHDVSIEFTCIFDTFHDALGEQIPASHTSNQYLARFFRCAPNIKRLALLDAGPFFLKPLNPGLNAEEFWADQSSWRAEPTEVPPVPLTELRELEYTATQGPAFFHFLSFFPSLGLEELRIGILDTHRNEGEPVRGPRRLIRDNMLPESMDGVLSSITLPCLRSARVEVTSGEGWKYAFNRILMPALETLVMENVNVAHPLMKCMHQAAGACLSCTSPFAVLHRVESIFRDPRLVKLRRLEFAGVDIQERDVAENWVGYLPALKELVCDYTRGANLLISSLAPRGNGALVPCPALERIELWGCPDVDIGKSIMRAVENRLKASERSAPSTGTAMVNGRKIKQLKRVERAMGVTTVAKIHAIKIGACEKFSEEDAKDLEKLGVELDWTASSEA